MAHRCDAARHRLLPLANRQSLAHDGARTGRQPRRTCPQARPRPARRHGRDDGGARGRTHPRPRHQHRRRLRPGPPNRDERGQDLDGQHGVAVRQRLRGAESARSPCPLLPLRRGPDHAQLVQRRRLGVPRSPSRRGGEPRHRDRAAAHRPFWRFRAEHRQEGHEPHLGGTARRRRRRARPAASARHRPPRVPHDGRPGGALSLALGYRPVLQRAHRHRQRRGRHHRPPRFVGAGHLGASDHAAVRLQRRHRDAAVRYGQDGHRHARVQRQRQPRPRRQRGARAGRRSQQRAAQVP